MDIPFTPYFFKKLGIYQQLSEIEAAKKEVWKGEKSVLKWAAGPKHQHTGSYIGTGNVRDALQDTGDIDLVGDTDVEDWLHEKSQKVLDSLELDGFAERHPDYPQNKDVRIIKEGLLAGRILLETDSLKNCNDYKCWINVWWVALIAGGVLLLSQAANSLLDLACRPACW